MAGVEIVADRQTKEPEFDIARRVSERSYALGVWANLGTHVSFGGTFRIAPPITITKSEVGARSGTVKGGVYKHQGNVTSVLS